MNTCVVKGSKYTWALHITLKIFLLPCNDFLKIYAIQYNTLCVVSKGSPPFINIPLLAPIPVPTITAVGVARPKAQGQAISKTASACVKAWLIS